MGCYLTLSSMPARAEEVASRVTITFPKIGEIVGPNFTPEFALGKGTEGDHVHVYMNGKYL